MMTPRGHNPNSCQSRSNIATSTRRKRSRSPVSLHKQHGRINNNNNNNNNKRHQRGGESFNSRISDARNNRHHHHHNYTAQSQDIAVYISNLPESATSRSLAVFLKAITKERYGMAAKMTHCRVRNKPKNTNSNNNNNKRCGKQRDAHVVLQDYTHAWHVLLLLNGSNKNTLRFRGSTLTIRPWHDVFVPTAKRRTSKNATIHDDGDDNEDEQEQDDEDEDENDSVNQKKQDQRKFLGAYRSVFIGGLPESATDTELSTFLNKRFENKGFGLSPPIIENCTIHENSKGMSSSAFVEFQNEMDAWHALKLNGNHFGQSGPDLTIKPWDPMFLPFDSWKKNQANPYHPNNERSGSDEEGADYDEDTPSDVVGGYSSQKARCAVFVRNLAESVTSQRQLTTFFQSQLHLKFGATGTQLVHCSIRQDQRDAFVEFATPRQAHLACQMDGQTLHQTPVTISSWNPRMTPAFYKKAGSCSVEDGDASVNSPEEESASEEDDHGDDKMDDNVDGDEYEDGQRKEIAALQQQLSSVLEEQKDLNERQRIDAKKKEELAARQKQLIVTLRQDYRDLQDLRIQNEKQSFEHLSTLHKENQQLRQQPVQKHKAKNATENQSSLLQQEETRNQQLQSQLSEQAFLLISARQENRRSQPKLAELQQKADQLDQVQQDVGRLRDELEETNANHAMQVGSMEASSSSIGGLSLLETELTSAKEKIKSLQRGLGSERREKEAAEERAACAAVEKQVAEDALLDDQQLRVQNQQRSCTIEKLQQRLQEADDRFFRVTESLALQTTVVADERTATRNLEQKLKREKEKRRAAEQELRLLQVRCSKVGGGDTIVKDEPLRPEQS